MIAITNKAIQSRSIFFYKKTRTGFHCPFRFPNFDCTQLRSYGPLTSVNYKTIFCPFLRRNKSLPMEYPSS
jgi:hypothetical protein